MIIVGKFSKGTKTAQIARVVNKKGQTRFIAIDGEQLLSNQAFARMYNAKNIINQYFNQF